MLKQPKEESLIDQRKELKHRGADDHDGPTISAAKTVQKPLTKIQELLE